MDEFTQKLLDFIVKYTWHVFDENGSPAKLSYPVIKMFDMNDLEIDFALEYLREKKLITQYSFSNRKIGLRATTKGNTWSRIKFSRKDIKRWLIVDGLEPKLIEYGEYVNSRQDMSFIGNKYCKYCGDLIDEKEDPFNDVCSNCYVKELEDATK